MRISTQAFAAAFPPSLPRSVSGAHADLSSRATTFRGHGVVSYGDLNLETEQGARSCCNESKQRPRRGAAAIRPLVAIPDRVDRTFEECWTEAIARTVKQLGAPVVTRVYAESARRESGHG